MSELMALVRLELHRPGTNNGPVVAALRSYAELLSVLEFLDRGDGNRGTHGSDMRAPALVRLARELGWPGLEEA